MNHFKVKLISNELPLELVNLTVKRELKFSDMILYNVKAEHSDRVDSFLKSTRALRVYRSHFRQIFPKPMTNDTENSIEVLQLEDVDFRVQNSVLINDNLKALSLTQTLLKPS